MREAAFERTYGSARGSRPQRVNPKSGTGMKQARQATGGATRREGEKPWGRNVTGADGSAPGYVALCVLGKRCRGTNLGRGESSALGSSEPRPGTRGDVLVILCEGAKALERIFRDLTISRWAAAWEPQSRFRVHFSLRRVLVADNGKVVSR